jgi:hypothetical protein
MSPTEAATTAATSSDYHVMTGGLGSPVVPLATPLSSPDSNYLPMDLGNQVRTLPYFGLKLYETYTKVSNVTPGCICLQIKIPLDNF